MAQQEIENPFENSFSMKRYFINNLDSYHAEFIVKDVAKILNDNNILPASANASRSMVGEDYKVPSPPADVEPYEIIGTVTDPTIKKIDNVSRIVPKEEAPAKMLTCGNVVLDISYDRNELKLALDFLKLLKELFEKEPGTPFSDETGDTPSGTETRHLILISTVMTWASTKPLDPALYTVPNAQPVMYIIDVSRTGKLIRDNPDIPLEETDFRKRKPHPNYKLHLEAENAVILLARKHKTQIRAVVVAAGVTYGGKEDALFYWFQKAWENEPLLPILGRGNNAIPIINVQDLAKIIYNLLVDFPKKLYILAVEQNVTRQREIVKPLGRVVGTGLFKCIPPDDAFLIPEIDQRVHDLMTLNLYMEPTFIVQTMQWTSEFEFKDNVQNLIKQFKKERGLRPFKLVIYGPPLVGKTTVAKKICDAYGLVYISPDTIAEDMIKELTFRVSHWDSRGEIANLPAPTVLEEMADEEEMPSGEEESSQEMARQTLAMLMTSRPLSDEDILLYIRQKLLSNEAQNRGWVLDGYPINLSQCSLLFGKGEEPDETGVEEDDENQFEEDVDLYENVMKKLLPDIVVSLEATDDFIYEKAMNQPHSLRFEEEEVVKRVFEYRLWNTPEITPLNFFDELDIHPLVVPVDEHKDYAMDRPYADVTLRMGRPCRYQKLMAKIEVAEKKAKEEFELLCDREAKIQKELEIKMQREREEKMEYWSDLYASLREEEEAALAASGEPMRKYLINHIFPTLTPALLEIAKVRPDDPVDYLAEYLFKKNPLGKMPEPGFNFQADKLLGKIKILDKALEELDLKMDSLMPSEADEEEEKCSNL